MAVHVDQGVANIENTISVFCLMKKAYYARGRYHHFKMFPSDKLSARPFYPLNFTYFHCCFNASLVGSTERTYRTQILSSECLVRIMKCFFSTKYCFSFQYRSYFLVQSDEGNINPEFWKYELNFLNEDKFTRPLMST